MMGFLDFRHRKELRRNGEVYFFTMADAWKEASNRKALTVLVILHANEAYISERYKLSPKC